MLHTYALPVPNRICHLPNCIRPLSNRICHPSKLLATSQLQGRQERFRVILLVMSRF